MSFTPKPYDSNLIADSIKRLKNIFQAAVDKSSDAAKPVFKDISDTFNAAVSEGLQLTGGVPDINTLMRPLALALVKMQKTAPEKVKALAGQDPQATATLMSLSADVQKELFIIARGGLATRPFGRPPKKKPAAPPSPKPHPKGPNSTDFIL